MDLVQLEQQPRPGAPMLERISHGGTCHRRDPRHYQSHASTILRHTLSAAPALPKVRDTLTQHHVVQGEECKEAHSKQAGGDGEEISMGA